MNNPSWNLEALQQRLSKEALETWKPPRNAQEALERALERNQRLTEQAIECERAGDTEGCWFAMATKAENQRLIDRIKQDIESKQ